MLLCTLSTFYGYRTSTVPYLQETRKSGYPLGTVAYEHTVRADRYTLQWKISVQMDLIHLRVFCTATWRVFTLPRALLVPVFCGVGSNLYDTLYIHLSIIYLRRYFIITEGTKVSQKTLSSVQYLALYLYCLICRLASLYFFLYVSALAADRHTRLY